MENLIKRLEANGIKVINNKISKADIEKAINITTAVNLHTLTSEDKEVLKGLVADPSSISWKGEIIKIPSSKGKKGIQEVIDLAHKYPDLKVHSTNSFYTDSLDNVLYIGLEPTTKREKLEFMFLLAEKQQEGRAVELAKNWI